MNWACDRGYDVDDVARAALGDLTPSEGAAFQAHLARCPACRRTADANERMRRAWRWALDRDDLLAASHREERLMRVRHARSSPVTLALLRYGLAAAAGAAIVAGLLSPRAREIPPAVSSSPSVLAPNVEEAPSAPTVAPTMPKPWAIVESVSGAPLAAGDAVEVAGGARLSLNWSIRVEPEVGLVDPAAGIDVEGPASVTSRGGALVLLRGAATARAGGFGELDTSLVRTRGSHARWRVEVRGERTLVKVLQGEVSVESEASSTATVRAGESVDVLGNGHVEAHAPVAPSASSSPPPLAPAPDPPPPPPLLEKKGETAATGEEAVWQDAQSALHRGDRSLAEAILRTLLESATEQPLRARAGFTLAELELSRGARDPARARLSEVMTAAARSGDPGLAADAAFLLGRSSATAEERADVYRRYLASSPPSPYREEASVEEAGALLDAGHEARARALVSGLAGEAHLPEVARASLEKIEKRLGAGLRSAP